MRGPTAKEMGAGKGRGAGAISRRELLGAAAGAAALVLGAPVRAAEDEKPAGAAPAPRDLPEPSAKKLPRWRGFNLLEKFVRDRNGPYQERDFAWIARWGFDFVRLPTDYRCWTDPARPDAPYGERGEKALKEIDGAVDLGKHHGVHVNLNLHRAPGYCVNPPREPLDLWKEEKAVDGFAAQWAMLAKRYRGIPAARLSFDLLNEPPGVAPDVYAKVMGRAVKAIHAEDPARLVIADGLHWGRDPVEELIPLGIGQSTRGYDPMRVSHHRASWVNGSDIWLEPEWPLREKDKVFDRERLRRERIEPWKALAAKGVGVHVGEWGAFNRTPRKVVLAWMRDQLDLWKEAGFGWAVWNLRGPFGIVDSGRPETTYEAFEGHQLDKEMLELLQAG